MKKFVLFFLCIGIISTYFFITYIGKSTNTTNTNEKRIIQMRAVQNEWRFEPEVIEAKRGEEIILKIYNEDEYDHGFAIESLGVNQLLPPKAETIIEIQPSKEGIFSAVCSVACGKGHSQMTGQIKITNN